MNEPRLCIECGRALAREIRGRPPLRCGECHRTRRRIKQRADCACVDCGCLFSPANHTGRPPQRCDACEQVRALERNRLRQYRWREAHPDAWKAVQARASAKRLADPEYRRQKREREAHRKYGLSPADFHHLMEAQGHACAICRYVPPARDETKRLPRGQASVILHVDHDHTTGRVRGLLCGQCNTMLGLAKENPTTLLAAIEYLTREKENPSWLSSLAAT